MMSTKSKPHWRHTTWNSTDCMVCAIAEPQKKLPVFKPGKWTVNACRKIALYGHESLIDAKNMKHLILHFENVAQCESLDRLWFGEVWFAVEKNSCDVRYAQAQDNIVIGLEPGQAARIVIFAIASARPSKRTAR